MRDTKQPVPGTAGRRPFAAGVVCGAATAAVYAAASAGTGRAS